MGDSVRVLGSLAVALIVSAGCRSSRSPVRSEREPTSGAVIDPHAEGSACVDSVSDLMGRSNMLRIGGYLHRALLLAQEAASQCESPETLDALAKSLGDLGMHAQALAAHRRFLEIEPHDHHKAEVRGAISALSKRPGHQRPEATADEKERAQLLYRHGVGLRLKGEHDPAIQRLRQSYRLWPHPVTIAQISLAHRGAGRQVEARKANDRAMAIAELITGKKAVAKLLLDHSDTVREIAWSPNGKLIASLGQDRTLKVWHAASGRVLETLPLLEAANSVQFLGNDAVLFGAGSLGAVRLLDLNTRALRSAMPPYGLRAIAANSEGTRFVHGGDSGTRVGVRTLPEGEVVWQSAVPMPWQIWEVSFDRQGSSVAVAGARALVLDAANGQQRFELPRHDPRHNRVAFSPDGSLVAAGGGKMVTLHDARTGALRRSITLGFKAQKLSFSADGTRLVTAGVKTLAVWDVRSGAEHARYANPAKYTGGLALSPDGGTIAVCGGTSVIHLIDTDSGAKVRNLGSASGRRTAVGVSVAGARLVLGSSEGQLAMWRLDRITEPQLLRHGDAGVVDVVFDGAGRRMVSVDADGVAVLWDARAGRRLATLPAALSAVFSADGKKLYIGGNSGALTAYESRTGTRLARITGRAKHDLRALDLSPKGDALAIGTEVGLRVQALESGRGVYEIVGMGAAGVVRYAPGGDRIAMGPVGSGWGVFDANVPGKPLVERDAHDGVYSLAFSPDGAQMVAAGWRDPAISVWTVESWRKRYRLVGHLGAVNALAFGKQQVLLSASSDKTLRVWNSQTGQATGEVYVGATDGDWIVLSADGRVDGAQGGRSQRRIYWQVGEIALPGFVGWTRARTPGLLLELLGHRQRRGRAYPRSQAK